MRPEELAVAGRGLAGLSHELKNVLAIIGESAGLVEDLTGEEGDERIRRALAAIDRQLGRAERLVTRLNRFAHAFDDPAASLPVGRILEMALFLTERAARTRNIGIEVDLPRERAAVPLGPQALRLVFAVATVLEMALADSPPCASLRVGFDDDWVVVYGEPGDRSPAPGEELFLAEAGCRSRPADPARGELFAIQLP
jgi:hypothetical protein